MSWHIDRHPDIRRDVPHDPHRVAALIAAVEAAEQVAHDEIRRRMAAERCAARQNGGQ